MDNTNYKWVGSNWIFSNNEIKKINEFVCSNHSIQVQPLAQEINKIFVETFGTDVYDEDLEQCTVIAKRILKIEVEWAPLECF